MYKKIIVDKNLKSYFTENLRSILAKENISYEFELDEVNEPNILFLTNDKNNIKENMSNVLLLNNDYDILNIKDTIFIKRIEDVVRVYKSEIWQKWAEELQFIAQSSLAYCKDKFDRERYERIREIACEMMSYKYDIPYEKIKINFAGEIGYQTPKVENRAAVIRHNKILLVKEQVDGRWALPGGYQDVDRTVSENTIKECYEEAGAVVKPTQIIAIYDYNKHHNVNFPLGMVKIFVLCDYVKHEFQENIETSDIGFFGLDELPPLSTNRTTYDQIKMCFDCYNNQDTWKTIFD